MDYMISNFCDEANHPVFNSKGYVYFLMLSPLFLIVKVGYYHL